MLASTFLLLLTAAAWDTAFAVRPGTRLEVQNLAGEIVVHTWSRDEVSVSAGGAPSDMEVAFRAGVVTVRSRTRGAPQGHGRHAISIPTWMALEVRAHQADVRVSGLRAPLTVESRVGDITVDGGRDRIALTALGGAIRLRRAQGTVEIRSVASTVEASDIRGSLRIATTGGNVMLDAIRANLVAVRTVSGRIEYRGQVEPHSRYQFATHDGEVSVTLPEARPVTLRVDRYRAAFSSELPSLRAPNDSARRFQRTHLGVPGHSGSAHVLIESFSGPVRLRRMETMRSGT